jgi:ABC-type multidrug transport system fused ATPase/permease subunit
MFRTFDKAQRLSAAARERYSSGRLVNLLMVDAARIADTHLVPNLHWGTWCSVLLLGVGLAFIYNMIGLAALAGLAVVLVCWPLAGLIVGRVKRASLAVQERRDARARLMSELIALMRVIRAFCWQHWAVEAVLLQRKAELAAQATKQYLNALLVFFITAGRTLAPTLSFLVYAYAGPRPLTAPLAFACLAWFNLLRRPLAALPYAATNGMDVAVSLRRLANLFAEPELSADRGFRRQGYDLATRTRIALRDASCEWHAGQSRPTLRNICLNITNGELVLVVGPVGSGKSSLLAAMLGEMAVCAGDIQLSGNTAVVTQQPWTQHATVRENILFGHMYEEVRYQRTILACGLSADLKQMPHGDATLLGDSGATISGGQRQRICLARAVYSQRDVVLLDDVLSAVDAAVGRHLFDKCICGELRSRTRVVVTHQMTLLSRPEVSRIIVMAPDGTVAGCGTFGELQRAGTLQGLSAASMDDDGDDSGSEMTATASKVAVAS